jgi:hypothetical protein
MLIDDLGEAVRATITNWTEEMKRDHKAVWRLAQIGGEQKCLYKMDDRFHRTKRQECLVESYVFV